MVLPLRFPPGMAGGLLLAYPRMKKPDHSGVVIACLAACVTFSPLYIPAPISSIWENGISGTVNRFRHFGSMKYIYRSWKPGIGFAPT